MMTKISDILRQTKTEIKNRGWIQQQSINPDTGEVCLIGGLHFALGGNGKQRVYSLVRESEAGKFFAEWLVGEGYIPYVEDPDVVANSEDDDQLVTDLIYIFNDSSDRREQEIYDILDAAAADWESQNSES